MNEKIKEFFSFSSDHWFHLRFFNRSLSWLALGTKLILCIIMLVACSGRNGALPFRIGSMPIGDFPLYFTDSLGGTLNRFDRSGAVTTVASGLDDPRGVAIDQLQNIYVAEYGGNRILKVDHTSGAISIVNDLISSPWSLAIDSQNEVYATSGSDLIRVLDNSKVKTFDSAPLALAFGVDDQLIVALSDGFVYWGNPSSDQKVSVNSVSALAVDLSGRVYIAEAGGANIYRYHQRSPGTRSCLPTADCSSEHPTILNPVGIAVDPAGEVYVAESRGDEDYFGITRINLKGDVEVVYKNSNVKVQYLAFTKY